MRGVEPCDPPPLTLRQALVMPVPESEAKFRFIELFAGIGGFRLCLEKLGGYCVWSSEKDSLARQTYVANFDDFFVPYHDVTSADLTTVPSYDILTGGFPCQDFSRIGSKDGLEGDRGALFYQIPRFLQQHGPAMFLLENVRGLTQLNEGKDMATVLAALEACGYQVHYKVLNADCWLPQFRRRVFMVGLRSDLLEARSESFAFPHLPHLHRTIEDVLHPEQFGFQGFWTLSEKQWRSVREAPSTRKYGMERRMLRPGVIADTLLSNYRNSNRCFAQFVPVTPAQAAAGRTRPRWLTPRECCRLMGFPETFKIHPDVHAFYVQIGNAIPLPLVTAITGHMLAWFHQDSAWETFGLLTGLVQLLEAVPVTRRLALLELFLACCERDRDLQGEAVSALQDGAAPHEEDPPGGPQEDEDEERGCLPVPRGWVASDASAGVRTKNSSARLTRQYVLDALAPVLPALLHTCPTPARLQLAAHTRHTRASRWRGVGPWTGVLLLGVAGVLWTRWATARSSP
eukprot:g65894.t1